MIFEDLKIRTLDIILKIKDTVSVINLVKNVKYY